MESKNVWRTFDLESVLVTFARHFIVPEKCFLSFFCTCFGFIFSILLFSQSFSYCLSMKKVTN